MKKRKQLQSTGIVQVIYGGENNIQLNPTKRPRKCQFCSDGHSYPACPSRERLKMSSNEFLLSTDTPLVNEGLRSRLKFSVPYSVSPVKENVLYLIASHLLKANFIIHEAVENFGFPTNQIESFNYKVTFLGKDAMPLLHQAKVWVSGGVMNTIITPQFKKIKFVYDETISVKEGWITRGGFGKESV